MSREILGLFGATGAIAVFFYGFLSMTANSIVLSYADKNNLVYNEITEWTINSWIQSLSILAAVILFVVLFLFLIGQKISYLNKIIQGVEALRMHRMDFEMPIEGENEFTELAESINFLSKTERELKAKEAAMHEEREKLIRALSHDIRTPLTSILSYSEYLGMKEEIGEEEIKEYISLMQQKAEQIKILTDRLLDGDRRNLEMFEDGKFLMVQLANEWSESLEDEFTCLVNLEDCPQFSGKFDVQELRRIFDNLASNIEKYAERTGEVRLVVRKQEGRLVIKQENKRKNEKSNVESYKIGIESIRSIAEKYGGKVEVEQDENEFSIEIMLSEIE